MQSFKQIENIVQNKIHAINNKKVIEEMQIAVNDIQKEQQINKRFAFIGLAILIPIIIYLILTLLF